MVQLAQLTDDDIRKRMGLPPLEKTPEPVEESPVIEVSPGIVQQTEEPPVIQPQEDFGGSPIIEGGEFIQEQTTTPTIEPTFIAEDQMEILPPKPPASPSRFRAFGRGVVEGFPVLGDVMASGVDALTDEEANLQSVQDFPAENIAGNLVGAIGSSVVPLGVGARALNVLKGPSLAKVGKTALAGGVVGGTEAAGREAVNQMADISQGDFSDVFEQGTTGAALGSVTAGGLTGANQLFKKLITPKGVTTDPATNYPVGGVLSPGRATEAEKAADFVVSTNPQLQGQTPDVLKGILDEGGAEAPFGRATEIAAQYTPDEEAGKLGGLLFKQKDALEETPEVKTAMKYFDKAQDPSRTAVAGVRRQLKTFIEDVYNLPFDQIPEGKLEATTSFWKQLGPAAKDSLRQLTMGLLRNPDLPALGDDQINNITKRFLKRNVLNIPGKAAKLKRVIKELQELADAPEMMGRVRRLEGHLQRLGLAKGDELIPESRLSAFNLPGHLSRAIPSTRFNRGRRAFIEQMGRSPSQLIDALLAAERGSSSAIPLAASTAINPIFMQ